MNSEIGLDPASYGFGASIFFVGYILFQAPSVWALKRFGARLWLFGIVAAWGSAATAMAFIRSPMEFYVVRVVLGFAEAGFAPGVIYLAATWIPVRYRANAIASVMLAVPISLIIGGPICASLMSLDNPLGMSGWRWMSLVEGALTVVFAFLCLAIFVDDPKEARWLSPDQKTWLAAELEREEGAARPRVARSLASLASDARTWLSAFSWFSITCGLYGVIFWLPQIVKHLAGGTPLQISMVTMVPWIACAIGTLLNARHSDKTQERHWHCSLAMLVGGAGLVIAGLTGNSIAALAGLALCGLGIGGAQGTFWTIPPIFLGRANANTGVPLINMIGSTSGILAPYLVGLLFKQTGSFIVPLFALAVTLVLAAGAVQLLRVLSNGATGQEANAAAQTGDAALASSLVRGDNP